jgi:hypothetical protein
VAFRVETLPVGLKRLRQLLRRGVEETATLWPAVRVAYRWVKQVAQVLKNRAERPVAELRRRLPVGYVERWRQTRAELGQRRQARRQQRRFRRSPVTYLERLEELADKLSLPP